MVIPCAMQALLMQCISDAKYPLIVAYTGLVAKFVCLGD
jgi:hypothetical protein